jgi:hypothetical protein
MPVEFQLKLLGKPLSALVFRLKASKGELKEGKLVAEVQTAAASKTMKESILQNLQRNVFMFYYNQSNFGHLPTLYFWSNFYAPDTGVKDVTVENRQNIVPPAVEILGNTADTTILTGVNFTRYQEQAKRGSTSSGFPSISVAKYSTA